MLFSFQSWFLKNSPLFYWHFLEILWIFIFLVFYNYSFIPWVFFGKQQLLKHYLFHLLLSPALFFIGSQIIEFLFFLLLVWEIINLDRESIGSYYLLLLFPSISYLFLSRTRLRSCQDCLPEVVNRISLWMESSLCNEIYCRIPQEYLGL